MKPLSLLLAALLLPAATSQCAPCDITPNGFTVRPGTGCVEYISCVDGAEANVQSCQGGTVFDLAIVGCNWAEMVTCPPDPECKTTTTIAPIAPTLSNNSTSNIDYTNTSTNNTTTSLISEDIIPLKFTVYGLSNTDNAALLKSEMTGILQMILFELEELEKGSSGLKILNIVAWQRARRSARALQQGSGEYELMFDVNVVPVEGVDFAPIIIDGIRNRYDSLVQDVRGWTDSEYVTTDFGFEVCAHSDAGDFSDCSSDAAAAPSDAGDDAYSYSTESAHAEPAQAAAATTTVQTAADSAERGLPTAIVVIISVAAVFICLCLASAIAFVGFRKREEYDSDYDDSRGYSDSEGEYTSDGDDSGKQMVPYNEERRCYVDEEDQNSSVLPRSAAPNPAGGGGSVRSGHSKNGRSHHSSHHHSANKSRSSRERGDASGYEVRSHISGSGSQYSRRSKPPVAHPDPSVYNVRPDARDPSVYHHNNHGAEPSVYRADAVDPSVYNPNNGVDPSVYNRHAEDPEVRSQYSRESRDQFSHRLESLGGNSRGGSKKSGRGSVRMDYSVVSELSEPSITGRYA